MDITAIQQGLHLIQGLTGEIPHLAIEAQTIAATLIHQVGKMLSANCVDLGSSASGFIHSLLSAGPTAVPTCVDGTKNCVINTFPTSTPVASFIPIPTEGSLPQPEGVNPDVIMGGLGLLAIVCLIRAIPPINTWPSLRRRKK